MDIRSEDAKIVILSGVARSGKDKVSVFMRDNFLKSGKKVINLQFSKYIKDYAMNISDWDGKDETKPRKLLQFLGTEIVRKKIDDKFFIRRMIDDIKVYSYFFDVIIISDARFVNEIELVKSNFKSVVSINIVRPNFVSELTLEERNHATETGLVGYEDFDRVIVNDGTLQDLESKVIDIMKELF